MSAVVQIKGLSKVYKSGFQALKNVNLELNRGEIFALLGPNGAGKTTLISIICGLVNPSHGQVVVDGHDIVTSFRKARKLIGLVPQELTISQFESVWSTVCFSRGLFGLPYNPAHIETILKELSLWDKKDEPIMALSGGMKRRVLIAKALSHEPEILFLDEPTAGVDVSLRAGMWRTVRGLADRGVTIVLTTHYIEEAEAMANRVGVINGGEIMLVENTQTLMRKLGRKELRIRLQDAVTDVPPALVDMGVQLEDEGRVLLYPYEKGRERKGITKLFEAMMAQGLRVSDLDTKESSLEDIFVELVGENVA